MKTETKIILGMMAGSGAFKAHFTNQAGYNHNTDFDYEKMINLDLYLSDTKDFTIQARKSIKPLFSFNYLLSLLSSGILPEVIAEKLEQDGIKIEWI